MRARTLLAVLVVIAAAGACVRLGFWQLGRLAEKRAVNGRIRESIARPPEPFVPTLDLRAAFEGRRVWASGVYDESRHILLAGRAHGAAPGVHVVTPLQLPGGKAVLVDRGWLPAEDAALARPQDFPEPGPRVVIGLLESIADDTGGPPWRPHTEAGVTLWSVRRLDLDSLRALLPYPVVPYLIAQLPDTGLAALPLREPPTIAGESMHLGYAIQWFSIAVILAIGSLVLLRRERR